MFWNGSTAIEGLSGSGSGVSLSACLVRSPSPARVQARVRGGGRRSQTNGEGVHRPGDVLDLLLALVFEGEVELVAYLVAHHPADADAAGLGKRLQPRGDIDAVAVDVALVDDDVADIDAHAKLDTPVTGRASIAPGHVTLDIDGAAHRINDAGEFDQHPIPGGLDDPAAVFLDLRIDQLAPRRLQRGERSLFVGAHQTAIAGNISWR
jgi:hypothetical protein